MASSSCCLVRTRVRLHDQTFHNGELARREIDGLAIATNFLGRRVEGKRAERDLRVFGTVLPAHQRIQARAEFIEGEGLDHIVVSPDLQSTNAIFNAVPGREYEDVGGVAGSAQLAQDGQAIHAEQHDIEDDSIVHGAACVIEARIAVGDEIDRIADAF